MIDHTYTLDSGLIARVAYHNTVEELAVVLRHRDNNIASYKATRIVGDEYMDICNNLTGDYASGVRIGTSPLLTATIAYLNSHRPDHA